MSPLQRYPRLTGILCACFSVKLPVVLLQKQYAVAALQKSIAMLHLLTKRTFDPGAGQCWSSLAGVLPFEGADTRPCILCLLSHTGPKSAGGYLCWCILTRIRVMRRGKHSRP